MASDQKKVQTLVNICADAAVSVRAAISTMKAMRVLFNTHNPSRVGTPLQGASAGQLSNAIDALDTLVNTTDAAVWDGLIAAKVDTHRNEALS